MIVYRLNVNGCLSDSNEFMHKGEMIDSIDFRNQC